MRSELREQRDVVNWCEERQIKVGATAQSTFTNSWKALAQNRMAGVKKGIPDLIIVIPPMYRKNGKWKTVFIEMKREKGGVASKEQKEWIAALDGSEGVSAKICHGAIAAMQYLESFLELEPPYDDTYLKSLTS